MRILSSVLLILMLSTSGSGQFDLGVSVGGVFDDHIAGSTDDPHNTLTIQRAGDLAFSASAFYREATGDRLHFGLDLCYAHRSFDMDYSTGGLGGSYYRSAHVDIDQLYAGVKPELALAARRWIVLRFGVMAGFRVGGSAKGTTSLHGGYGHTILYDLDLTRDFAGDFRFAFGFGLRIPAGDRLALTLDPEITVALSSMLKEAGAIGGHDAGLRIGLSRRSNGPSLTQLLRRDRLARNAAPSP